MSSIGQVVPCPPVQPHWGQRTPGALSPCSNISTSTRRWFSTSSTVVQARGGTATGAEALGQPIEHLALALAVLVLHPGSGDLEDLVRVGVLHIDVDPADDALLEVRVEALLHVVAHLRGAADQQLVERRALEAAEELLGRVLHVVVGLPLDAALVTSLEPAALVVPAVHVVGDVGDLVEALARAAQDRASLRFTRNTAQLPGEGSRRAAR